MAVLGQSSLGTMRMNAARLNYHQAAAYLKVAGVDRSALLRRDRLHIQETVNSSPNTASFRVSGFVPVFGQDVKIYCGSSAATELIFAGTILRVTQVFEGSPRHVAYDVECIDYTGLLDSRLVFKAYTNVSASTIAADLVTTDVSGFTAANVQALLPLVSVTYIGVPRTEALTTLAQLIGAHWKLSYVKDLRFATTAMTNLPDPDLLTTANVLAGDHEFAALSDGSQLRTRLIVIGKGTTASAAAAIGDILLAIADSTLFPASGTAYVIGQKLTYTGIASGSTAPSTPSVGVAYLPTGSIAAGININTVAGVSTVTHPAHGYATGQQIVVTETPASGGTPIVYDFRWTITVVNANSYTLNGGPAANPFATNMVVRPAFLATATAKTGTATVTCTAHGFATGMKVRGYYARNALNATLSSYETLLGPITVIDANTFTCAMSGYPADVTFALIPATSGSLTGVYTYRLTDNIGGSESLGSVATASVTAEQVTNIAGYTYTTNAGGNLLASTSYSWGFSAVTAEGETAVQLSTTIVTGSGSNSAALLTFLPVTNDPRVLSRNVWRTPAGVAQTAANMRYVATLADDTTTSFLDTVLDANLGGAAPLVNTTGGAIKLTAVGLSANTRSTGREVYRPVASGTVYKHIGTISGTTAASFTDTVSDGAQAAGVALPTTTATASLTGIPASGPGSITAAINLGDAARPSVQRDDAAAQATLAAAGYGDGIIEDKIDDDTLASTAAMNAAGDAALTLFKAVEARRTFCGRDYKLQTGATVTFNLASPTSLSGSSLIQSLSITEIGIRGTGTPFLYPLRTVEVGTTRLTLPELLRQVALR